METPTGMAAGIVLTLFGGALLLWCAVEMRLRLCLRRFGVPVSARVVADADAYGALDSAPLLAFSTLPAMVSVAVGGMRTVASASGGAVGRSEAVVTRPRGHTPLRRPARLGVGTAVRVAYDPRCPSRVVLMTGEAGPTLPADLLWAALGTASLTGGLGLLASLAAR